MAVTTAQLGDLLARLTETADASRTVVAADLCDRWARARLRMLLVGEAKRGKSTVGNAILGRDVLPTGVIPLTAVTTTVRTGTPERVEVHHHDGRASTASVADLARYVTETGNPGNEQGVDYVVVHVESGLPHPSVDLIDTPGVGSVHHNNTAMAETAMTTMDVALFVLTADPPISAAEQDLLSRVRALSARTFVVLNKVDQLEPTDRDEAERFTRRVVAGALGMNPTDLALFPVSARTAVRAADRHDPAGWAASGMAEFTQALQDHLRSSWRTDLSVSIAGTARRIVAELLDEAALARRASEMRSAQQARQVAAFREHLDGLATRRDDATAVALAHLTGWRSALDEDAAEVVTPITDAVHRDLDARLAALPDVSTPELEAAGWSAITDLVVEAVSTWRATWSTRLAEAEREAARRQQHLLDEAIADIRLAAATLLGVDLTAAAPRLALPDTGTFDFDLTPDIGWNQPVTSAVRRHIPGASGRARMRRYLHTEAARLVDKHIGRARSDFQVRLERAARDLRTTAAHAYTQRQGQLRQALAATDRDHPDSHPTGPHDSGSQSAPVDAAAQQLEILAEQLDVLLESATSA